MKTAVVAGGGIAGILSAILLQHKFNKVYLIEKEAQLGGLIKSYQNELGLSFDYGTHFLRDTQVKELDDILFGNSKEQLQDLGNLKGGGYYGSKYNAQTPFIDSRNLPEELYQKGMFELLEKGSNDTNYGNLEEQLKGTFGDTLTEHLFKPILEKKFYHCELRELSTNAHLLFGLSRIIGFNPATARELKKSDIFNQKLGFHSFNEGVSNAKNYYPIQGGIGEWTKTLVTHLSRFGVKICCGESVTEIQHSNKTITSLILSNGEKLTCDHLVWTVPAFLCLQVCKLNLPTLNKPVPRLTTTLLHFTFDQPFDTSVYWFHCFEPSFSTFRVTLYSNFQSHNHSAYHLTAEVISREIPDPEKMSKQVHQELIRMGTVSQKANILFEKHEVVRGGFPLPTHQFVSDSKRQLEFAKDHLKNITFLGKASGNTFFMHEVLMEVYNTLISF